MLKRLWLLLSTVWALLMLGVFLSDSSNTMSAGFVAIALGPLALGWLVARGARFVVTGSPAKPRGAIPYRRP